jgi:hypothetical protein
MIFEMFGLLLVIVAFLCWLGYYSKIRAFAVVGMSILFLLSSWIILYNFNDRNVTGLEYKSGFNITDYGTYTVTNYIYDTYNDDTTLWVGFLLAFVSAIGIWLVAVNNR